MRRGQGSMEYMMTYGWAILAVMVVGVAIWHMGILNTGSTVPPTATGFEALKPLLTTCKMSYPLYLAWPTENGIACQFANAAGQNIRINNITATVNGEYCYYAVTGPNLYEGLTATSQFFYTTFTKTSGYIGKTGWTYPAGVTHYYVDIPAGETFTVAITECPPDNQNCPCTHYSRSQRYNADIDITYTLDAGGVVSTRHSIGAVSVNPEMDSG
jgi:hypothetical protein